MKTERVLEKELLEYLYKTDLFGTHFYGVPTLKDFGFDLAAYDKTSKKPKVLLEIKLQKNNKAIINVINNYKKIYPKYKDSVRYCLVLPGDNVWPFHMYDLTPYVEGNKNFNKDDFEAMRVAMPLNEPIPPVEKKRRKQKSWLNITCRFIILPLLIIMLVLDITGIVELTTNRLILYSLMIITLLVPFYDTITYKDFTLQNRHEKRTKNE